MHMPAHSRSRHQRVRLTRLYTFDFRCRFASPPSSAGSAAPSAGLSFSPQRERFRGASPAGRGCSPAAPVTPTIATCPGIPRRGALAVARERCRRASERIRDGSQRRKVWLWRRIHSFDVASCHREQPAATFQSSVEGRHSERKVVLQEAQLPPPAVTPRSPTPPAAVSRRSACVAPGVPALARSAREVLRGNTKLSSTHEREARCGPPFSQQRRRPACSRPHCW